MAWNKFEASKKHEFLACANFRFIIKYCSSLLPTSCHFCPYLMEYWHLLRILLENIENIGERRGLVHVKSDIVLLLQLKHILESFNYCCENSNGNVPSYFTAFLTFSVGIGWDIGVKKVNHFITLVSFYTPWKYRKTKKAVQNSVNNAGVY